MSKEQPKWVKRNADVSDCHIRDGRRGKDRTKLPGTGADTHLQGFAEKKILPVIRWRFCFRMAVVSHPCGCGAGPVSFGVRACPYSEHCARGAAVGATGRHRSGADVGPNGAQRREESPAQPVFLRLRTAFGGGFLASSE